MDVAACLAVLLFVVHPETNGLIVPPWHPESEDLAMPHSSCPCRLLQLHAESLPDHSAASFSSGMFHRFSTQR